ncbi:MAG: hypothetical protein BIFFINMI_02054 [Phycisphaerae bacterium]|nr:hypothetical protein [Phycisphaerae bacterium]
MRCGLMDKRYLTEDGPEIFLGNELLLKGALETPGGVHLMTGYPGSPVAAFFNAIHQAKESLIEHGVRGTIAGNEAISIAMVNGSQLAPCRSMAVIKSVGVHVASDGLFLGNLAGTHAGGGVVIVYGDDPWSHSTQVPADSRFISEHLHVPVLEPADSQELKDWIALGFELSNRSNFYIGYMVTTELADGGGVVRCRANHWPAINEHQRITLDSSSFNLPERVLLPPRTAVMEAKLPDRVRRLREAARELGVDRVVGPAEGHRRIGFVTSGMAFQYLQYAAESLGWSKRYPVLKLGLTYPLDPEAIVAFARRVDHLIVVEERRSFIERQISEILTRERQALPRQPLAQLWGKTFPGTLPGVPSLRGLSPALVVEVLAPLLETLDAPTDAQRDARVEELKIIESATRAEVQLPTRTPTFCPGCPHRDSSNVLLEIKRAFRDEGYMRRHHRRGPVDLVFHGDTGCYTMLMFAPNESLMHDYSGMGLGGATGAGIDPFIDNKQVVFMGDSTFFHSGSASVSNAIKQGQDITFIILDNKTTAMTGHQPTPSVETDILGRPTFAQDIEQVVRGMSTYGPATVVRVNPERREEYKSVLEETVLADGVKVIVADKECGITYHRRLAEARRQLEQRRGFLPRLKMMDVTQEVCENCLECTKATGCPGLTFAATPYGQKVVTDMSWCVNDGACSRVTVTNGDGEDFKPCPSFAEVTVLRRRPAARAIERIDWPELPEPGFVFHEPVWRAHLSGVGGMGLGVAAVILGRAGFKEGYTVHFHEKKGLAIRNGGIYSQVTFSRDGRPVCQAIPDGRADLLLGVDLLEAARAVDPKTPLRVASPGRTVAVLNTRKTPTIAGLAGREDFDVDDLVGQIRRVSKGEKLWAADLSDFCEQMLGNKLYVNVMMLGLAWQLGLTPVSWESMEWGMRQSLRIDWETNLEAFRLGRAVAVRPQLLAAYRAVDYKSTIEDKADILTRRRRRGARLAQGYRDLAADTIKRCQRLSDRDKVDLAVRIYDCVQHSGRAYARRYAALVSEVYRKDDAGQGFRATRAALWELHRHMCIKDEIYVAGLLTSEEKFRRDRERYNVDPSRGDRLRYRFHTRPEFDFGRFKVRLRISTRPWQLRLVSKCRWLRPLLPAWHRREKEFRDWYIALVERFAYADEAEYDRFCRALECTREVTGYREVRYPKMRDARRQAERILNQEVPVEAPPLMSLPVASA